MKTPDLKSRAMKLDVDYVNKLLGVKFKEKDIVNLLKKMRYDVKSNGNLLSVYIPAYRTDVLHPMDLVEDIAIAYGYENFVPELPKLSGIGSKDRFEKFYSDIRELMLGFGFQEVMTLIMTNKDLIFRKMMLDEELLTETENPVSLEHSVARSWLLPLLMSVLEINKNRGYPQNIFEIGDCIDSRGNNFKKLSAVIAHSKTNFSEIKSIATGILESLNLGYDIKPYEHPSFIDGRCASVPFGFFGEINPMVLENFSIEVPVTALEFDLTSIFNLKYGK